MPTFQAINIEVEENVGDEIDTTREIHVEDALKRYQTALKLHAQGPSFFNDAAEAYDDLFLSDIFKYPEASTEYERAERQPLDHALGTLNLAPTLDIPPAEIEVDGGASSLPQAYYLAHKNRGQFALDRIRYDAKSADTSSSDYFDRPQTIDHARSALNDFMAALDRDPSDAELWRRAARVAAFLKSARINRFCLEAAIELDDDPAVMEVEPPSLAEALAGEELKERLQVLSDSMALSHPIMRPWITRGLPALVKRQLDPLPFLPDPTKQLAPAPTSLQREKVPKTTISVSSPSWTELGQALVSFVDEQGPSAAGIYLDIADLSPEDSDVDPMVVDNHSATQETSITAGTDETEAVTTSPVETVDTAESKAKNSDDTKNPAGKDSILKERSNSIASRKRSQSAAGVGDGADEENGVEKRSKRTRRRDTTNEDALDPSTMRANQLAEYQATDKNLFQMTKDILENIGVTDQETLNALDACVSEDRATKTADIAPNDLRLALTSFKEEHLKVLMNKKDQSNVGVSSFLEHSKSGRQKLANVKPFADSCGLSAFARMVNQDWLSIHDVAYEWVKSVCSSYLTSKWTDLMKSTMVQVISKFDAELYFQISQEIAHLSGEVTSLETTVQMILELNIDTYERVTNSNSVIEPDVRLETQWRLQHWLSLASTLMDTSPREAIDNLYIRFLWAAVFATALLDKSGSREHILNCWGALRDFLSSPLCAHINIHLPNNTVLSLISAAAADREISKLTTMDFFVGLFQDEMKDPVSIIDSLEPVLNPGSLFVTMDDSNVDSEATTLPITECASQSLQDLWKFLQISDTELRLVLWSRLGEAYGAIKYPTKQFSCLLRSIEMVSVDMVSESFRKTPAESRGVLFMKLLRSLDELIISALSMALNDNTSFDIIDDDHLRAASAAVSRIACLLHTAAMFEDEVRVGMTQQPSNSSLYQSFLTRLKEMQVRTWSLLYTLLKCGINNNKTMFPTPENSLADYLAAVHQVLGLRKYCKQSNKIFPKIMRVDLLKLKNIENWEDYLGQVLYDLHGLKLGVGVWDVQDHGCPPEKLEKRNAMQLVERVTILANRMPMKDLLKSDLKTAIEHIEQTIGQPKSTPQMIHNLRNFSEFMKKPIHPLRLFQAQTGDVGVDAVAVNTTETPLARRGWYFLHGMIALTRFKMLELNRRQTPGATDDLRLATAFLRLQLQFTPDKWDAWFRLAECFDYELDEAVLWTADKINKERGELVKYQRNAIHCYTLALSNSYGVDPEGSDGGVLAELYHKFAMRLYASSREPFAMEPFRHPDHLRFFIEPSGDSTFQHVVHKEMEDHMVWKFAAGLFGKAMKLNPTNWKNSYMYAKCLWKLYQKDTLEHRPSRESLIKSLEKSVQVAAATPKSRHSDPILEPHYKIVSVMQKLVARGDIGPAEAAGVLASQPFGIERREDDATDDPDDPDDWEEYVIRSLRSLRDKDKSNWQHRILMRQARVLFDDSEGSTESSKLQAKAAFNVLRETMFTKTMAMNVWKCEAERPGRHHVYTEQYVRFMVKLLVALDDRVNLEALLRRIRKKGVDFYHFNELWQSCCMAYIHLLRLTYNVTPTLDDSFKNVSLDDFERVSDRILDWADDPSDLPAFSCIKEAIELKKLNSTLMKATAIDDLVSDCYAAIFTKLRPSFSVELQLVEERAASAEPESTQKPDTGIALPAEEERAGAIKSTERGEHEIPDAGAGSLSGILTAPVIDEADYRPMASSANDEAVEKTVAGPTESTSRPRKQVVRRPDILRKAEQLVVRSQDTPRAAGQGPTAKARLESGSSGKNSGTSPNGDAGTTRGEGGSDIENDEDTVMKDADGIEGIEEDLDDGAEDGAEEGGGTMIEGGEDEADANGDDEGGDGDDEAEDGDGDETANVSSPLPLSLHNEVDDDSDLSDLPSEYDEPPDDTDMKSEAEAEPAPSAPLLFPNLMRSKGPDVETETADSESEAPSLSSAKD